MQTVWELLNLIRIYMEIGFIISVIFLILMIRSKVASAATKTYAIGSIVTFLVGSSGQYSIYFLVAITWGNVIGLFGEYVLLILAIVQYLLDIRKSSGESATDSSIL